MPKVLRLTREQAKLLACWLRMAAVKLDEQARHLQSCGDSFYAPRKEVEEQAERARGLARRLDA